MSAQQKGSSKSAKNRVQGVESNIEDLVLRNGRHLPLNVGVAEVPSPTLKRTIVGASSIEVPVFDPERRLLRHSLISQKWDAEVDGLHFRYPGGLSKSGDTLTLTLEDRWVALLREKEGPKRALRSKSTRAEFIKSLVEEACPGLEFVCPQLHVKQPIKTEAQGKKTAEDAKAKLGKGIGDTKGLTVEGQPATAAQKQIAQEALQVAESLQQPPVVLEAVMVALMDESHIGELTGGKNVLQAEGSSGGGADIGSTVQEVTNFLTGKGGYGEGGVIGILKKHPTYTPPELATTAQRNAAFLNGGLAAGAALYARFSAEAKKWVEAFKGGEFSDTSITVTEPFKFVVKKKEDFWNAIKRLAKDVNWRAFIVGNHFFFMPETELFQGMVRLAIDGDTPGVENIDFEYDGNHPVSEVTVEARIRQWKPPPGSVVTLADYGPASIGFGDAPVKPDKQGRKAGLSGNRKAKTGEGRARYIVSSIEVPVDDEPAQRLATIILKKPTAPLPEPTAETKSVSRGIGTGNGEYVNPFPDGAVRSRTDQGVDFTGSGSIVAIGAAKILTTGAPGWPEGGGVLYELLDGARAGQCIFVYEGVDASVNGGQKVGAGDQIATFRRGGSIEIGFADKSGIPLSHNEYVEGKETKSGKEMAGFLTSIGAP